MKIISVQFDYPGTNKYKILSQVFEHSVKKNCPNAELELIKVKPPQWRNRRGKSLASNTLKLDLWLEALERTEDDIIFIDCDMLILKNLESAFDTDFDIGYTKRTKGKPPYNGGVVFVRNTEPAKEFIKTWSRINNKMYANPEMHTPYRDKYAGMNQAAFGYIMEKKEYTAKLKEFPCKIWNACDDDWRDISTETRVMHIKSGLRRQVLASHEIPTLYNRAIIVWKNYAIEAGLINGIRKRIDNVFVMPTHPLIKRVRGLRNRRRKII